MVQLHLAPKIQNYKPEFHLLMYCVCSMQQSTTLSESNFFLNQSSDLLCLTEMPILKISFLLSIPIE